MKFPNHIILDVLKKNSLFKHYWTQRYFLFVKKNIIFLENLNLHKKFYFLKENLSLNKLLKNQKKFTILYSLTHKASFLNLKKKKIFVKLFSPRIKVKSKVFYSKHKNKETFNFLYFNHNKAKFDKKALKSKIKNFIFKKKLELFKNNNLWSLFNINFLKKEKIYTKLKYSRVPQYDIVSGGSAALLAGFLGFLICEKFGFELIDSGDFYFLFMYLVFLFFILRFFLKLINVENLSWNPFSLNWILVFYKNLLNLLIKKQI